MLKNLIILILFVILPIGCMPLTTNSPAFKNLQNAAIENAKQLDKVAEKIDYVADKVGVMAPRVSDETKDLIKQIQADNEKKYNAFTETLNGLIPLIKGLAPIAGAAIGIPPQATQVGLSITEALLGTGTAASAVKIGLDMWARRKREDEHQIEVKEMEESHKRELEKMRIKMLANGLTSQEAVAEYQANLEKAKAMVLLNKTV